MADSGGQTTTTTAAAFPRQQPRVRSADKTKARVTAVGENLKEKQVCFYYTFCLLFNLKLELICNLLLYLALFVCLSIYLIF